MSRMVEAGWMRAAIAGAAAGLLVGAFLVLTIAANAASCTSYSVTGTSADENYTDANDFSTSLDFQGGEDNGEMKNCNDTVFGGSGFDELHGAAGNDNIYGQADHDRPSSCDANNRCGKLFGGSDDDDVFGGSGRDDLDDSQAGGDTDVLEGEGDNDVLNAADGDGNDTLRGGAGTDNCLKDSGDTANTCE